METKSFSSTPTSTPKVSCATTQRRAVIDIGTNSVKLLVADVSGCDVQPVVEDSKQTRLGRGFYETQLLRQETIDSTAAAVARFAAIARSLSAKTIRVIATSAARDAKNPSTLTTAVEREAGLQVEIISGEREAELVFQGVTSDARLAARPLCLLDVGGGSTEFILGCDGTVHSCNSFPLGTVRLLESFPHSDPPTPDEFVACRNSLIRFWQEQVRPVLVPALQRESRLDPRHQHICLVGTGGTTSILARMEAGLTGFDRDKIEAATLSRESLARHARQLWSLPLAQRQQIIGLPPKRADVILAGVLIYSTMMEEFGFSHLAISTRGLRYGAVM